MRRISLALLAVLLLCAPALHAAPSDARGAIQAAYNSMNAGIAQKNLAKACAHLAPGFTNTYVSGATEDLQRFQFGMSGTFAECFAIRATTTVGAVSLLGPGRAVATVRDVVSFVYLDPNTLRRSNVVDKDICKDVWVRTAQGWVQKSSKNLSESRRTDGKPGGPVL